MRMATSGTSFRSALGSALGSDCYSAFSSLLQARQTLSSYRSRLMRRPMGLRGTTSTGSCGTLMDFCGSAPKRDSRASTATALPTTRRIRDCLIAGSLTCSKPAAASIGSRTATVYACSTLNPEDRMFTPYRPCDERQARFVNVLFEDHDGVVWCGTNSGVFRIREQDKGWVFEFIDLPLSTAPTFVSSMVEDSSGALWIGTAQGLFRRLPDGRSDRYTVQQGLPIDFIQSLLRDNENRVWAGTRYGGLCLLVAQPTPNLSVVARLLGRVAIPIVGRGRAREGDQRIRWQTIPRDTANSNTAFRMGLGPNRFPESRPESGGLIAPRASTGFPGWRKPGNLRTLSRRQSARAGMAWAATKCSACLKTLEAMSGLAPSAVLNES